MPFMSNFSIRDKAQVSDLWPQQTPSDADEVIWSKNTRQAPSSDSSICGEVGSGFTVQGWRGILVKYKTRQVTHPWPEILSERTGLINLSHPRLPLHPPRSPRVTQHLTPGSTLPGCKTLTRHVRTSSEPKTKDQDLIAFLFFHFNFFGALIRFEPQRTDLHLTTS